MVVDSQHRWPEKNEHLPFPRKGDNVDGDLGRKIFMFEL